MRLLYTDMRQHGRSSRNGSICTTCAAYFCCLQSKCEEVLTCNHPAGNEPGTHLPTKLLPLRSMRRRRFSTETCADGKAQAKPVPGIASSKR